ncbi:MAG: DUF3630 family protein [Planctomycetes bacterium]|nr:DUF3630 family protein [Planctomycetota bacterium]
MIKFRKPTLNKMHCGNLCITLTEGGTWESFPVFAEKFAKQIGGTILDRADSVVERVWLLDYSGCSFRLVYDDYPNGITFESTGKEADIVVQNLFGKLKSEVAEDGI